jgi:dephospho-CoA kinase
VAHDVYQPGSHAIQDIVAAFGDNILQTNDHQSNMMKSTIDRKKLGSIVFADKNAMSRLESIVWPYVRHDIMLEIARIRDNFDQHHAMLQEREASVPVVVVEAAMLLDAGWYDFMDGLWFVTVQPETAVQRLMMNRGLSREEAEKRLLAQSTRRGMTSNNVNMEVANGVVTQVISNDGNEEALKQQLQNKLNDVSSWYSIATKQRLQAQSIS